MSTSTLGLFLRHLALSEEVGRLGTASDHDLLATYESQRGQAVFTELMRRHGPMVLRTCRRVLGRGPDAEDAFQATFVLLARKATQLRRAAKPLSLGGWLHRVAYRTAADVLTSKIRRQAHERQASAMTHPDPDPSTEATWNEIRPILDAELDALPEQSRRLLIACYLQEKTHAEAAAELGLPQGSVAWRLERARALLAARLARRGITVSALLLAGVLEESARGAGMPAVLLVHTVEAARTFPEQATSMVSDHVARLVKGGLAQMSKGSTHLSIAMVGWVGLLGAGLLACQTLMAWSEQKPESEPPATAERSALGEGEQTRTDRYSDPLPPGALARLGTVRMRQPTGVNGLAFTRDGKGLITAGKMESARLWDVASGGLLRQFGDKRDDRVYAIALSPDGRTLAKEEATSDLCLWDVATGTLLRRLKGSRVENPVRRKILRLAFSPDGKTLASGGGTPLRLWEVATGKELWAADRVGVAVLTYSADGKTLIWAGHNGDLHLWDVATGKEFRHWDDEKKRSIFALAPAPNGSLFAAYASRPESAENLARLWDVSTGKEVWSQVWQRAADESAITTAVFSPDGKVLATGCMLGPLRLWDAATGKELRRCGGYRSVHSSALAFAPDGKTLASGDRWTVHLWDVGSGREIRRDLVGHEATVSYVAFTPNGQDIVSGSQYSLRVWDAASGEQRRQVLPAGNEHFVGSTGAILSTVSLDGKTLAAVTQDRIESKKCSVKFRRWDRDTGRELRGWSREVEDVSSPVISPDGKAMACRKWRPASSEVYLWETATGKEFSRITGSYPAFSPDGKLLATATGEGKEKGRSFTLWEAATAKELCTIPIPEGDVHRLLFSPDSRMLATASNRKADRNQQSVIHLWPLLRDETRKSGVRVGPPRMLATSPHGVGVWAFSPDSRTLALAGKGGAIRLLETASGKERGRFAGHSDDVQTLSFAPDGRRLASGSHDTTVLVWDVTGRLQDGHLRLERLSDKDLEKLWADLAADDAGRAARALWTLAADSAQSVPYLRERLQTSVVNAKTQLGKVPHLLRDLDDDTFAVRERAKAELAQLGTAAEPGLRKALAKAPSVETRRSLEQLLKAVEVERQMPCVEELRGIRALEVLEQIGTREARQALKDLTAVVGAESALTQEAHAALERLNRAERR